jgi:hypothetical protein
MVYKEYIIAIDSSTDIYNGNLSSFTCLLPTRFKNIEAVQLVDITLPSIANMYYEYLAIEGLNQISGPSGGMNFAFAKITLDGVGNSVFVADTNTYNYDYIRLGNPIAGIDRLQVSFVDARANLVTQSAPCNFQLRMLKKEDSSIYGYGDELTPNQNVPETYRKVPRARRK